MKEFIHRLSEKLLVGIFILGIIIVFAALKSSVFNIYMLSVGVLFIAISAIIYYMSESSFSQEKGNTKWKEKLKRNGIKIPVDLSKCQIKSNSWVEERERYMNSRVAFWNEVGGDSEMNVEKVESIQSRIEYSLMSNGIFQTFLSPTIAKDETTLRILLELKKETVIYVDRDNFNNYYFDLEFLD